jgi:hypothetical protein
VVRSIIRTYYPSKAGLVRGVVWNERRKGLLTDVSTGGQATGSIEVGRDFLEHTPEEFARRVLQVGHELEHVEQHRRGLGGPADRALREFLAFAHAALATELPGTGRQGHGTRLNVIDAALGEFFCMSPAQQAQNAGLRQQLLDERVHHDGHGGHAPRPAPTVCTPSTVT